MPKLEEHIVPAIMEPLILLVSEGITTIANIMLTILQLLIKLNNTNSKQLLLRLVRMVAPQTT